MSEARQSKNVFKSETSESGLETGLEYNKIVL